MANTIVRQLKWTYGITTVPSRRRGLFPATLASLSRAGFTTPRVFVDGCNDALSWEREFSLSVSCRFPTVRTFGNWVLGLWELYLRDPVADRYAMFQDDFITYKNLRTYLERVPYPPNGYCNLYTFPSNQSLAPKTASGGTVDGWYPSNQLGRGAVALVFSNEAVRALLVSLHMVDRPQDAHRGWKAIDGGIVTAFTKMGWKEYVHSPSLTQHVGDVSSMGNRPHLKAVSFRGEDFDAMELLGETVTVPRP